MFADGLDYRVNAPEGAFHIASTNTSNPENLLAKRACVTCFQAPRPTATMRCCLPCSDFTPGLELDVRSHAGLRATSCLAVLYKLLRPKPIGLLASSAVSRPRACLKRNGILGAQLYTQAWLWSKKKAEVQDAPTLANCWW